MVVCPNCGTKFNSGSKKQPISFTLYNVKGGKIEVREFKHSRNENPKRFKAELVINNSITRIPVEPATIELLAKLIKMKFHITEEQRNEILNGVKSQL